jgi:hypothetical protein
VAVGSAGGAWVEAGMTDREGGASPAATTCSIESREGQAGPVREVGLRDRDEVLDPEPAQHARNQAHVSACESIRVRIATERSGARGKAPPERALCGSRACRLAVVYPASTATPLGLEAPVMKLWLAPVPSRLARPIVSVSALAQ